MYIFLYVHFESQRYIFYMIFSGTRFKGAFFKVHFCSGTFFTGTFFTGPFLVHFLQVPF